MIKNTIIFILTQFISIFCVFQSHALENKHEVSLGYGLWSTYDLAYMADTELTGLPAEYELKNHTGTINLEYLYRRETKVSFGGIVSFSNQTFDHNLCRYDKIEDLFPSPFQHYYVAAKTRHNRLVLMSKLHLLWVTDRNVYMYSKFAAGTDIKFITESPLADDYKAQNRTKLNFAAQVSPICVNAGYENLRFYLECGIGSQAMVELGISYRFGK